MQATTSWPTPTATDGEGNGFRSGERSTEPKLAGAASMWGTPVARDDQKSPEAHTAMKQRALGRGPDAAITSLTVQVKDWPTPTAGDTKASGGNPDTTGTHGTTPTDAACRLPGPLDETTGTDGSATSPKVDLNPRFVEALMGVPPNWLTPSTSVETASFLRWLHTHSLSSPTVLVSTRGA